MKLGSPSSYQPVAGSKPAARTGKPLPPPAPKQPTCTPNRRQRLAARASGSVLVIAGPGTGKTTVVVARIIYLIETGVDPDRILAVTFTNKGAQEITDRVEAATGKRLRWVGTYHGLSARLLQQTPNIAGLRAGFTIIGADRAKALIKEAVIAELGPETPLSAKDINELIRLIDWLKDHLLTPEDRPNRPHGCRHRPGTLRWSQLMNIYRRYQKGLQRANMADFGDLLMWPVIGMDRDSSLRQRWAGMFDAVVADEFQDTTPAQYWWLRRLAGNSPLLAVGDDEQAIYGWRNADPNLFRKFRKETGCRVIPLTINYRSTKTIRDASRAAIDGNPGRLPKAITGTDDIGAPITLIEGCNPGEEAEKVVTTIINLYDRGAKWSDCAILYRSAFISKVFEQELERRGVPYTVAGSSFFGRAEVKEMLAYLQLVDAPDDPGSDHAFERIVNTPKRGLGPAAVAAIRQKAASLSKSMFATLYGGQVQLPAKFKKPRKLSDATADFLAAIARFSRDIRPPSMVLPDLLKATGYRDMCELRSDAADLRACISRLHRATKPFATIREFLNYATLGEVDDDMAEDRVRLMTLHKAKGLEFDNVFLTGSEDHLFPTPKAVEAGSIDEEQRLAYVGMTRARKCLAISRALWRAGTTTNWSPFINDIPDYLKVMA